jgi:hypothetical protein
MQSRHPVGHFPISTAMPQRVAGEVIELKRPVWAQADDKYPKGGKSDPSMEIPAAFNSNRRLISGMSISPS